MKLKLEVDKIDDVSEAFRALYTQNGDKWQLTGVEGGSFKDVKDLKEENGSWRIKHREAKSALDTLTGSWGDLKADEVKAKLTKLAELEAASEDSGKKIDDVRKELAAARTKLTEFETTSKKFAEQAEKDKARIAELETKDENRTILDAVRAYAAEEGEGGPQPQTYADELGSLSMIALRLFTVNELGQVVVNEKAPQGFTAFGSVKDAMNVLKEKHSYLWPPSKGGGALGSDGKGAPAGGGNPFKTNDMGARGAAFKADRAKAEAQMREAGLQNPAQGWDEKNNRPVPLIQPS